MTIKFICSCGKHLKARDEMAARRSVCPRCGNPVGIPPLQPTHHGIAAVQPTPEARMRPADQRPTSVDVPVRSTAGSSAAPPRLIETALVGLLTGRRGPRPSWRHQPLETHWSQCLLYPLRAWRLWFPAALVLTAATAAAVLVVPGVLAEPQIVPVLEWVFWLFWLLVLLLVIGYPCRLLQTVLESSAAGKVSEVPWRGHPLVMFFQSGIIWLICFLAGPVVPAGIAVWYWLHVGDAGLGDWLILGELAAFAVSYWLLALAAVCQRGRLRDANPIAVIDCAHSLGYRAAVAAALVSVLALSHGRLALAGALALHETPLLGWFLLAACWVSGLFWATFLFRLVGLWCYRRPERPRRFAAS